MARTLNEAPVTTANARSKLVTGEYARRLDADAALWYRKGVRGGVWFARWRNHGPGANYKQKPIGPANDLNDKPTDGLFTFLQAEKRARDIIAEARQAITAEADGPAPTVRSAVKSYVAERDDRASRRKGLAVRSDAAQRLGRYVLGHTKRGKRKAIPAAPLADAALHALTETDLKKWRASLPAQLKATTRQRLINDVKAALNSGYEAHRATMPASLPTIIKHGLKAEKIDDDEAVPLARENQILTDAQVSALIGAARAVDAEQGWDDDLFRIILVLAATGARFSQIARMKVGDVQRAHGRLMVPVSRKGKGKSGQIAVQVGRDVLDELQRVVTGRKPDTRLLERWRFEQRPGGIEWHRADRGPWLSSSELVRPWGEIRQRAGLPSAIPYALRHSSIVRGIRANLPIRLVAALHDTSVPMIERHYSKWIVDGLEELAAKAIVPLVPQDSGGKVIILKSGM
ncbi:tyrosine-type recombinase/integrase [Nordella sp. HKS 07]|uniref:tyrosine-type recombinase/integrase n=1 Tax=Nordella sp. HKS 07 TaxID=2712222 RepID=UPI0013E19714|nr:tyrosine-type recombinase/integrase [Nordella sp. HKS 07]QIG46811.1 tyrosine-type recombinase/integrase [Nordella sp. HKS 07]